MIETNGYGKLVSLNNREIPCLDQKNIAFKNLDSKNSDFDDNKKVHDHKSDRLISDTAFLKIKADYKEISKLPKYAANGLKGDKNATFFEFMQLGKIPYVVGGLVLIGGFAAGGKGAIPKAKQVAAGVAAYYTGSEVVKAAVDKPVKIFRGVDLNKKYEDVVDLKLDKNGIGGQKTEYHKVFESTDFTRWDLLYEKDPVKVAENPDIVNRRYDELAKKMGVKEDLRAPDKEVKPYIQNAIVASKAWKSALMVPMAGVAIGMSNYEGWQSIGRNLKTDIVNNVVKPIKASPTLKNIGKSLQGAARVTNDHLLSHVKNSFTELWKGNKIEGAAKKHLGKGFILATAAGIVLANCNILKISKIKPSDKPDFKDKFELKNRSIIANKIGENFAEFAQKLSVSGVPSRKENEYIL